ncbi:MAG: hypothetical protein PHU63_02890 [Candidatus ainarchaeum sp.]|nr:hypothetical protein [Candidatus ainarchaeum sp.]
MKALLFLSYIVLFVFLVNMSMAFGEDEDDAATQAIHSAICKMVELVKASMGAVFLILVVLSAIVYAGGQILGAETRARANVWATSMFVGAIIGGLIYLVIPVFLTELIGEDITSACEEALY